jgi:hypothetical protein
VGGNPLKYFTPVVAASALLIASACTDLTQYTKVVDGFATATQKTETALASYNKFDANQTDRLTEIALNSVGKAKLIDCSTAGTNCRIEVVDLDRRSKTLHPSDKIPNTMASIREFTKYAASLKSVLLASDEEEIAKKLNGVTNTVNGIAGLLQLTPVQPFALVANRLIAFGYDEYLAKLKLDLLRDITKEVEDKIADETRYFQAVARFSVELETSDAYRKFDKDREAFYASPNTAARAKLFSNLQNSVKNMKNLQSLKTSLRDKDTSVFSEMRKAHKALHNAFQTRKVSTITSALKQTNIFLAKAKKTAGLIEEIKGARND